MAPSRRGVILTSVMAWGVLACRPTPPAAPVAAAPPSATAAAPATASEPQLAALAGPDAPPRLPPPNAETSSSGVAVVVLDRPQPDGITPRRGEMMECRFRVWDETGKQVGGSRPGKTQTLTTEWLPPGWVEAMLTLHVGDHAQIWVPAAQAYPDHPGAPQGALVIDLELVTLDRPEPPASLPDPIGPPPPNALHTSTGLAFSVIQEGKGERHPTPQSRVTVHYAGWTASDGKLFDSSHDRGSPATFPVTGVIEGWQEALPLMVEGEKTRFWIPVELAYENKPGRPQGMLIFDIELLSIDE